jgi:phytoene synthase
MADLGLIYLQKKEAKSIKVARVLYSKILDKIEGANYNIFSSRIHLSFVEKIYWALLTLIKKT